MDSHKSLPSIKIQLSDFLLLCAVLFFIPAIIVKISFKILSYFAISYDTSLVISGIIQDIAMLAIIYGAYQSLKFPKIAFNPIRKIDTIVYGCKEFVRISIYAFLGNLFGFAVFYLIYFIFGVTCPSEEQYLIQKLQESDSTSFIISTGVLCVITAPIVEEIVFRYFLYRSLKNFCSLQSAMLWSAIIFAILHGNAGCLFGLIAVGYGLAMIYEKYGSIIPCICAHGLFNLFTILVTLNIPSEFIFNELEKYNQDNIYDSSNVTPQITTANKK